MWLEFLLGKLTAEIVPAFEKKHCLRYRNQLSSCEACLKSCPHQAVEMGKKTLTIDYKRCQACGGCIGVCPTNALTLQAFSAEALIRKLRAVPNLVLGCGQPENRGTINVPCINGLSDEMLATLFLLSKGRPWAIQRGFCSQCSHCDPAGLFESRVERVCGWLEGLQIPVTLEIKDGAGQADGFLSQSLSRRELFGMLRTGGLFMAEKAAEEAVEAIGVEREGTRQRNRHVFTKALEQATGKVSLPQEAEPFLLAAWQVEEPCDGCGFCQGICPAEAWQVNRSETEVVVSHHSGRCRACGLCVQRCPQKAIVPATVELDRLDCYLVRKRLVVQGAPVQ